MRRRTQSMQQAVLQRVRIQATNVAPCPSPMPAVPLAFSQDQQTPCTHESDSTHMSTRRCRSLWAARCCSCQAALLCVRPSSKRQAERHATPRCTASRHATHRRDFTTASRRSVRTRHPAVGSIIQPHIAVGALSTVNAIPVQRVCGVVVRCTAGLHSSHYTTLLRGCASCGAAYTCNQPLHLLKAQLAASEPGTGQMHLPLPDVWKLHAGMAAHPAAAVLWLLALQVLAPPPAHWQGGTSSGVAAQGLDEPGVLGGAELCDAARLEEFDSCQLCAAEYSGGRGGGGKGGGGSGKGCGGRSGRGRRLRHLLQQSGGDSSSSGDNQDCLDVNDDASRLEAALHVAAAPAAWLAPLPTVRDQRTCTSCVGHAVAAAVEASLAAVTGASSPRTFNFSAGSLFHCAGGRRVCGATWSVSQAVGAVRACTWQHGCARAPRRMLCAAGCMHKIMHERQLACACALVCRCLRMRACCAAAATCQTP